GLEPGPEETAPAEAVADEAEAVTDASGDVPGTVPETAAEEQVWTRAVSFGRKDADATEPVAETAPVEAVSDGPEGVADASDDLQGSDLEPGPEETPAPVEAVADGPEG